MTEYPGHDITKGTTISQRNKSIGHIQTYSNLNVIQMFDEIKTFDSLRNAAGFSLLFPTKGRLYTDSVQAVNSAEMNQSADILAVKYSVS